MILVTGGTGFVGRHLVRALVQSGKKVRCLIRESSSTAPFADLNLEIVRGDVTAPETLPPALRGVETLIHLVATIVESKGRTFERINVLGTRNLMEEARKQNLQRVIHLSALGASPRKSLSYTYSKWLGEEEVRSSGLPYAIFRPSVIFGPEDKFFNLLVAMARKLPFFPVLGNGKARFQPIWVKDLATCILKALDDSRFQNQILEIGGPDHVTYEDLVNLAMEKAGCHRIKIFIPLSLVYPAVWMMEKVLRGSSPVTIPQLKLLSLDNVTHIESVQMLFSFSPSSLREVALS